MEDRRQGLRVAGLLFGAPDGGSFIVAGACGLQQACAATGCDLELVHCDTVAAEARQSALEAMAQSEPDLIVVHGGQGDACLAAVAPHYPNQRFALGQGLFTAPNVMRYTVLLEQAAYQAGALAAWLTRTGVVAHLSGEKVGPGLLGAAAFRAGALAARPSVTVLSTFCGHQHDPALAAAATRVHAGRGADVMFTMLGAGRSGAIEACRSTGMRQIGDGIDWCAIAPDVFVASVVADSSWCTRQAVTDWHAGRWQAGGLRQCGLDNPEVCRLEMAVDVPAALQSRVAALAVWHSDA